IAPAQQQSGRARSGAAAADPGKPVHPLFQLPPGGGRMSNVLIVAHKEFRDGLRNRWVLAISIMLGLLAIGIAYFGAAASGSVGFTSLPTTIVSLSSLAVFLIPLIALLLAYDAVVGEQHQGT